jgi:hypothetical protein
MANYATIATSTSGAQLADTLARTLPEQTKLHPQLSGQTDPPHTLTKPCLDFSYGQTMRPTRDQTTCIQKSFDDGLDAVLRASLLILLAFGLDTLSQVLNHTLTPVH